MDSLLIMCDNGVLMLLLGDRMESDKMALRSLEQAN